MNRRDVLKGLLLLPIVGPLLKASQPLKEFDIVYTIVTCDPSNNAAAIFTENCQAGRLPKRFARYPGKPHVCTRVTLTRRPDNDLTWYAKVTYTHPGQMRPRLMNPPS